MKKWRIEFTEEYKPSPLSFWVHKHLDNEVWPHAKQYEPALPTGIPTKGFPRLIVDALGVELDPLEAGGAPQRQRRLVLRHIHRDQVVLGLLLVARKAEALDGHEG